MSAVRKQRLNIGRVLRRQSAPSSPARYLADELVADRGRRFLRSSADTTRVVPRTHNTFDDKSFAAAGPRVSNNLPSY